MHSISHRLSPHCVLLQDAARRWAEEHRHEERGGTSRDGSASPPIKEEELPLKGEARANADNTLQATIARTLRYPQGVQEAAMNPTPIAPSEEADPDRPGDPCSEATPEEEPPQAGPKLTPTTIVPSVVHQALSTRRVSLSSTGVAIEDAGPTAFGVQRPASRHRSSRSSPATNAPSKRAGRAKSAASGRSKAVPAGSKAKRGTNAGGGVVNPALELQRQQEAVRSKRKLVADQTMKAPPPRIAPEERRPASAADTLTGKGNTGAAAAPRQEREQQGSKAREEHHRRGKAPHVPLDSIHGATLKDQPPEEDEGEEEEEDEELPAENPQEILNRIKAKSASQGANKQRRWRNGFEIPRLGVAETRPYASSDDDDVERTFRSGSWHGTWKTLPVGEMGVLYMRLRMQGAGNGTLKGSSIDDDGKRRQWTGEWSESTGTVKMQRWYIEAADGAYIDRYFEGKALGDGTVSGIWHPKENYKKGGSWHMSRGQTFIADPRDMSTSCPFPCIPQNDIWPPPPLRVPLTPSLSCVGCIQVESLMSMSSALCST